MNSLDETLDKDGVEWVTLMKWMVYRSNSVQNAPLCIVFLKSYMLLDSLSYTMLRYVKL